MSKQIADILQIIQNKTGQTLDEIGEKTGYTRPYLSKVKKEAGPNDKVLGRLTEVYSNILPNNTSGASEKTDAAMADVPMGLTIRDYFNLQAEFIAYAKEMSANLKNILAGNSSTPGKRPGNKEGEGTAEPVVPPKEGGKIRMRNISYEKQVKSKKGANA